MYSRMLKIVVVLMAIVFAAVMETGTFLPTQAVHAAGSGNGEETSANQMEDWQYYKPVFAEGESTYKWFYLDEEIYRHAMINLADLRVIDDEGNPVPYYIETGYREEQEKVWQYETRLIETIQKEDDTITDFEVLPLEKNEDIRGNFLRVHLPDYTFLKHVKVEGSYDGNRWEYVGQDYVYRMEQRMKDTIALPGVFKYTYYRLTILDNAENVTFTKLNLLYNSHEVWKIDYEREKSVDYELKNEGTKTIVMIDNPDRLRVREIRVEADGNFQREFVLYDQKGRPISVTGNELYSLHFTGVTLSGNTVLIKDRPATDQVLELVIENRDDAPLSITDIVIRYSVDILVFEDKGSAEYRLYFGNPHASMPQYDLSQFKAYVENEQQDPVRLGAIVEVEKPAEPEPSSGINKEYLFNGVIVAVSLLLVFLLARKLNGRRG